MKKLDNPSEEAADREEPASVYDFLYCDHARVGSLLAQFNDFGSLRELTHRRSASSSTTDTAQTDLKLSVAGLAEGGRASDNTVSQSESEGKDSVYDPRWINALNFMDEVHGRGLLTDSIETAGIGQLVMLTGELAVFDMSLFEKMWEKPSIKQAITAGEQQAQGIGKNRQQRRANVRSNNKKGMPSEAELATEIMGLVPHSIQGSVYNDEIQTWFTLSPDNMTVKPSDIFFKHGLSVSGTWTVIGALDAYPDDTIEIPRIGFTEMLSNEDLRQLNAGSRLSAFGMSIGVPLLKPIKGLLGRPAGSYGLTPLVILRIVGRAD